MYQHQIHPLKAEFSTPHSPTIIRERAGPATIGSCRLVEEGQQIQQKNKFEDIGHKPICSGPSGAIEQNVGSRRAVFKRLTRGEFATVVQDPAIIPSNSESWKDKGRGNKQIPPQTCPQPDQPRVWETNPVKTNERLPLVEISWTGAHVVHHFSVPRRPKEDETSIVFYDMPTNISSLTTTNYTPRTSVACDQAGYEFINLEEATNATADDRTRPLPSHSFNIFSIIEQVPQMHYSLHTEATPPHTASTSISGDEAGSRFVESNIPIGDDAQDISPAPSSSTTGTGTAQEDPKQTQRPQTNAMSPDIKDRFVFLTKRGLEEALIPLIGE